MSTNSISGSYNAIKEFSEHILKAVKKKIELSNIQTYDDLEKLAKSSVSIFGTEIKTDEQKKQAYIQYSEKLLQEYYDLNKDGKVTTEEFATKEKESSQKAMDVQSPTISALEKDEDLLEYYDKSGDGKISNEEYIQGKKALEEATGISFGDDTTDYLEINEKSADRSGNLFAQNLDMNADGIISAQELAFFNETADSLDGTDGIITHKKEIEMFESVIGKNANDSEINRVVNKYLLGEDLTPAEQEILKKSQTIIRNNMKKAAGF